jgi:hypothetical protein
MTQFDEHEMPDELNEVAKRLRDAQPTFSAVELDQLKLRTMAKASARTSTGRPRKGFLVKSRLLTFVLAAALLGGTAAGGIADTSGSGSSGSAADAQYKPPAPCSKDPYPFPYLAPPGYPKLDCIPFPYPYIWCPGYWQFGKWYPGYWYTGPKNPGHGYPGPGYAPPGTPGPPAHNTSPFYPFI